jgi:valyl-tRNA synthetase
LRELAAGETAPPSALAVIGDMRAMVPMEGLIDPQAEVARLEKRAAKTRDEIQKARNKLANENFVRNAPPEVVTQEQGRVADFERTLASIDSQLQRVRALLK